jgi:quercetin dioxygenase-like cupin family protein
MKKVNLLSLLLVMVTMAGWTQDTETQYVFKTTNLTRYQFPTHINDLVMDRSEARFSELFIVVIEPGKGPPLHRHNDTEQIFYLLEGSGTLTIGKESPRKMPVSPGDVVRIPVGDWHTVKADQGTWIKYLAIDCFGSIRNEDEPTWDSHVRVLCKEQNWDYNKVLVGKVKRIE